MLAEQVTAATGRAFRIDGKPCRSACCRPSPSRRGTFRSANADWGSQPDMARLRRAAFEVSLRDLLDGEIRILSVDVEGADVWLESDGAGRFNWQFGARKSADGKSARADHLRPVRRDRLAHHLPRRQEGDVAHGRHRLARSRRAGRSQEVANDIEFGQRRWKLDGETGPLGHAAGRRGGPAFRPAPDHRRRTVSASGTVVNGRRGIIEAKMASARRVRGGAHAASSPPRRPADAARSERRRCAARPAKCGSIRCSCRSPDSR